MEKEIVEHDQTEKKTAIKWTRNDSSQLEMDE
jgi:hypothetical protein